MGELAKEIDTETYSTLAALCLDYPFNTPDAWVIVEEETGLVANLLMEILRDILDTEKQIIVSLNRMKDTTSTFFATSCTAPHPNYI